ncbi:MAG: hypothetical protein J0H73_03255, partial [Salana multivorans]|nr:hypothetical protein [Salana multivorans]
MSYERIRTRERAGRARGTAGLVRRGVAGVLAALLSLATIAGLAMPAAAAGGQVTVKPPTAGSSHDGKPVFEAGRPYVLEVGYGSMDDGAVAVVEVPDGVVVDPASLVVPPGNTAVASLDLDEAGNV